MNPKELSRHMGSGQVAGGAVPSVPQWPCQLSRRETVLQLRAPAAPVFGE